MVTGSHIPSNRNGIKFSRPDGEVLKPDEAAITAMEIDLDESKIGAVSSLPPIDPQAKKDYIDRYLNFFPKDLLENIHIGLYGHSAVGRDIIYSVLTGLGAKVTKIDYSDTFVPVDTENVSDELISQALSWYRRYDLDFIVTTDGDSDRPLLSDEHGNFIRSDIIGIPAAKYLQADAVAITVSGNTAIDKSGYFKKIDRTKIGSPHVIAQMNQLVKDGYQKVVGYEANGGFITASNIEKNGQILKALPTRDALIAILCCLALSKQENEPLSQIISNLPSRYTDSDSFVGFPTDKSLAIIDKLSTSIADIDNLFAPHSLKVLDINTQDGLRITFTNGEIIHLRPSRNSPEFRDYTEADTPQRAKQLSDIALAIIKSWST